MDQLINLPIIAPNQLLPIFIYSTLVLVFGAAYAALITLGKMGFFSHFWKNSGYLFWILQAFSLYQLSVLIESDIFVFKVLIITMIAYLFIPHLYFYLIDQSEKRYE